MTRLFVKNLTVIDFSYLDPKRGLLGESWIVDIELTGSLDHQGMVLDFSDVKKKVKQLIDEDFDHKLIVPKQYSENHQSLNGKRIQNIFTTNDGIIIEHIAPESAYYFLDAEKVTPDQLAAAIIEKLNPILPDNVENVVLKLYPENIVGAFYHYSHGLKHHAGNCQRIAHGHRSKIEIFETDNRNQSIEQFWADKWKDIYIGTKTDIFKQFTRDGIDYILSNTQLAKVYLN